MDEFDGTITLELYFSITAKDEGAAERKVKKIIPKLESQEFFKLVQQYLGDDLELSEILTSVDI
jgi:hypothetical protein